MVKDFLFGAKSLDFSTPQVMGILNVTPDSFSDGGSHYNGTQLQLEKVIGHARTMVEQGATMIDVGGESTRPGAAVVGVQEELDRVIPAVERISAELDVVISVDTSKPKVMIEAAKAGAHMINDVRAFQQEGALAAAVSTELPVCIMHMQGQPKTMQSQPEYDDVITEVLAFLRLRMEVLIQSGIPSSKVMIDPGFGFGKTVAHNLSLLKGLQRFSELGVPVLVGLSRKSLFESVLGRKVNQRLAGSLASALLAAQQGASIIRVHDVQETADVLTVWKSVQLAR